MEVPISGYDDFVQEVQTLISTYPPPFVYIYDPISLRTTSTVLKKTIFDVSCNTSDDLPKIFHVHLDAVTCFSQRLLFDNILNSLPCLDPGTNILERWNDSWDSFLHGIRYHNVNKRLLVQKDVRFVISIEQVHRLKEKLPDSIIPLSRLNELVLSCFLLPKPDLIVSQSQVDITVVFISQTQWQDIKPALGASPEPYYIDVKPLTKSGVFSFLLVLFHRSCRS